MLRMETKAWPERMGFDTWPTRGHCWPTQTAQRVGRRLALIGADGEARAGVEVHHA